MLPILKKNPDMILDTIKKIAKADMVIAKDCACKISAALVKLVPSSESAIIEVYSSVVSHDNAAIRKMGAKHLKVGYGKYVSNFY